MAGGVSPCEKRRSVSSRKFGRNAERFFHMSTCPVSPWITYTDGYRTSGSLSYPGGRYTYRGRSEGSPSGLSLRAWLETTCWSRRPANSWVHGSMGVLSHLTPKARILVEPCARTPLGWTAWTATDLRARVLTAHGTP